MSHLLLSLARRCSVPVLPPTNNSKVIHKRGPIINCVTGEVVYPKDQYRLAASDVAELKATLAALSPEPISTVASFIQPLPGNEETNAAKKPRKKRTKPQGPEYQPTPLDKLEWLTIAQAAIRFPNYSEKAYRHLVAQAEAYAKHPKSGLRSNGFLPCVVRPAGKRKILINAEKFEEWLKSFAVSAS